MNKNIKVIPFPDIPDAYIVISAYKVDSGNGLKKCMSFMYANAEIGAEWEPEYGPITIIYPCSKEHPDAQEHFFYPYITGYGNWSQLAVKENNLDRYFINGDYHKIFAVLKAFAQ